MTAAALSDAERTFVGQLWQRDGLYEHASVASFAVFLLQAMQLGAPPTMLRRTIEAMDDEVRHAILCFRLANRFLGTSRQPGRFVRPLGSRDPSDEGSILEAVIGEACVTETISVAQAAEAWARAEDHEVRFCLATIVAEERRHSELAWDFVAWLLATRPHLRQIAAAAFTRAFREVTVQDDAGWMVAAERFGHLPAVERNRIRGETIERELRPRLSTLGIDDRAAAA